MRRTFVSSLLLVALLSACSKKDEQKPAAAPSAPAPVPAQAPAPVIPPPQLIITNAPAAATPDAARIEKGIQVKGAGNLYLTYPKSWMDKLTRVQERGRWLDYVLFRPRTGREFALMVGVDNVGETNAAQQDIKAILKTLGQLELTNAVEKSIVVHDFQGGQMTGAYFVLTDKNLTIAAPKPEQYLYVTQGFAKTGGLILSFRLYSDHLSPAQEDTLEMIKSVRFEKK